MAQINAQTADALKAGAQTYKRVADLSLEECEIQLLDETLSAIMRLQLHQRAQVLITGKIAKEREAAEKVLVEGISKACETLDWDTFFAGQTSRQPPKKIGVTPDGREVFVNVSIRPAPKTK